MIAFTREKVQEIRHKFAANSNHLRSFLASFLKGALVSGAILIVGGYGVFRLVYWNKILPGVYLLDTPMAGQFADEAVYVAREKLNSYLIAQPILTLAHKSNQWRTPLYNLGIGVDEHSLRDQLMKIGRNGSIFTQVSDQWRLYRHPEGIALPLTLHQNLLQDFISTASARIENPLIPPSVYKGSRYNPKTQSLIYVERGQDGEKAYIDETVVHILDTLSLLQTPHQELITRTDKVSLSENDYDQAALRAVSLLSKSLSLTHINPASELPETWTLSDADLLSFLSIEDEVNATAVLAYAQSAMQTIQSPPQNAVFRYNPTTSKVEGFRPGVAGVTVQVDTLALMISEAMEELILGEVVSTLPIPTIRTPPKINTGDVNDLGIQDLIGRGESTYYHSSASRKHNVEYAAALLDGVLVPPGEKFSFNDVVGEISITTGFKRALIIKNGETLLGDGGGVCQDSTTLFRAMLDAGLPISGWRNHSFRVGYYEQNSKPGFDATIYSPLPDLSFTNNTPGHILIQTTAENMQLTYELYGTDDGREAVISNYTQWDAAPPPPDLYKDDPTLPIGVLKKVESAVPGLKTKFDYVVTLDGETLFEKTFLSVYQPWQAVYLRGTKV